MDHSCSLVMVGSAFGQADGDRARTYAERGNARLGKKEYDKAIADFNEAIRLDPKNRRDLQ